MPQNELLKMLATPPILAGQQQDAPSLLQLPTELRNRIYAYVLSSPAGIKLRWQKGTKSRKPKPCMFAITEQEPDRAYSINPLQYVNRQLHQETAGLEIQFNRVTFATFPKAVQNCTAMQTFYDFLGRCTIGKRPWLKHVFIAQEPDLRHPAEAQTFAWWMYLSAFDLFKLLKFCIANPQIRIDFQMPHFTLEPTDNQSKADKLNKARNFIGIGVTLRRIFRGIHEQHKYMEHRTTAEMDSQISEMLGDNVYAVFQTLAPQAPNLRIFPRTRDLTTCLEGRRFDWRQLAYVWARNGI